MKRFSMGSLVLLCALAIDALPVDAQFGRAGFGGAVAVSGSEVLIGVASNVITPGAVYVFRREAGGWTEVARLQASDAVRGDGFGTAVVADASTMLVSAPRQNDDRGAVYVFERSDAGDWQEAGRLPADGEPETNFGSSIALAGELAVVGAPGRRARGRQLQFNGQGTVHVFADSDEGWISQGTLEAGGEGTGFGSSVAIHGDHEVFVGAPLAGEAGAVYAFRHHDGAWQEAGELRAPGIGANDRFGSLVRISGNWALVSAPGHGQGQGAVFTFQHDRQGEWSSVGHLLSFDGFQQDGFGSAIAVAPQEGVWIGAPRAAGGRGAAYAISGSVAGGWDQAAKLATGEAAGDAFASAIAIDGDIAVVGVAGAHFGTGMATIYERTDAGWEMAASVMGEVEGFEAVSGGQVDCTSGVAADWDCEEYDLVSFLPVADMAPRGVTVNDVWGWTDPETGNEYALVGRRDGSAFVDVSDPLRPRYLGQLLRPEGSNPSTWTDIKVYQDHAFIVADGAGPHGVQVFDLTQLRNVTEPVTFEETAHYDGIASAHNIAINEDTGFAYTLGNRAGGETCGGGLHILDIGEPTNPMFAGCFADIQTGRAGTGYTHDAQCVTYHGPDEEHRGKLICMGSNETALSIADVTDPANPVALAMASYPNAAYAHQGWLTEDQRYFYMNDEGDEIAGTTPKTRTLIWDVSDLDDPQLVKEHMGTEASVDHNLYIRGNLMYQSNYNSGLRVLDISDPENPVEVGHFDTVPYGDNSAGGGGGSWSNYPYFESGVLIVTSSREGLFVLKKRQPIT